MAEIVLTNNQETRMDGGRATAEEKADYLLKNNYPVPTFDREELVELILKRTKKLEEEEKAAIAKANES